MKHTAAAWIAAIVLLSSSAHATNSVLFCNDESEMLWSAVRYRGKKGYYQTTGYHVIRPKECISPFSDPLSGQIWIYGYTEKMTWEGNGGAATFCVRNRHFNVVIDPYPEFNLRNERCISDIWNENREVIFRSVDIGANSTARITFSAQGLVIQSPLPREMPSGVSNAARSLRGDGASTPIISKKSDAVEKTTQTTKGTTKPLPTAPACFPSSQCVSAPAVLAQKVVYRNSCDRLVNLTFRSSCNGHNTSEKEEIQISPNGTAEIDRFVSYCSPLGRNTFVRWIDKACY